MSDLRQYIRRGAHEAQVLQILPPASLVESLDKPLKFADAEVDTVREIQRAEIGRSLCPERVGFLIIFRRHKADLLKATEGWQGKQLFRTSLTDSAVVFGHHHQSLHPRLSCRER